MVLSWVDQLYDTRQRLLSLTAAVAAQDRDIQAAITLLWAVIGDAYKCTLFPASKGHQNA